MTGTELLPTPAWVQAVFVCLFIVLIVWLLSWMSKRDESTREFQRSESDKWQKFIADENNNWREFNKKQRDENNCAMADVNASLSNLTNVTGDLARSVEEMRSDINAHDQQAKEILALVSKPQPKPRVKKPTDE